jgi:hypothetical protein
VKEPADAGFTVIVPLALEGAVKAGSVLLQAQMLLLFVFHDSVAPLPWTATVGERPMVGCCTTVKATDCVVVAGTVHVSV